MAASRRTEARRWFQQASYDLKAARRNIDGGFHSTACFLSQQAGEKALKSLLYYLGARRKVLLTHSLFEMATETGKRGESLGNLLDEARQLDLHYIPSHYPNGLPSGYPHQFYGKETAEEALGSARKIVDASGEYYRALAEEEILSEQE